MAQLEAKSSTILVVATCLTICSSWVFIGSILREEKHQRLLREGQFHLQVSVLLLSVPRPPNGHSRVPDKLVLVFRPVNLVFLFCLLKKVLCHVATLAHTATSRHQYKGIVLSTVCSLICYMILFSLQNSDWLWGNVVWETSPPADNHLRLYHLVPIQTGKFLASKEEVGFDPTKRRKAPLCSGNCLLSRALSSEGMVTTNEKAVNSRSLTPRMPRCYTWYLLFSMGSDPAMCPGNWAT